MLSAVESYVHNDAVLVPLLLFLHVVTVSA